ncbi:MAG: ABC transporter [Fusobacteriia bacterium 4572_132]|nr:MAG: ABC transporter [Fusobacteriia bacterium 4572_132]
MINENIINEKPIAYFLEKYPFLDNFFSENNLNISGKENLNFYDFLNLFTEEEKEDFGISTKKTITDFITYTNQMIEFLGIQEDNGVHSVSIIAGNDKSGNSEKFEKLTIKKGEIVCIVGPTGSGKSRLLADIEWTAQNDTPTKRSILINNEVPDKKWRFSSGNKLVAQLSQNMNFVMDLTVYEFLELHAKSRMVENIDEVIAKIVKKANNLAGEKFTLDTPVTSLSGGQSRAIMIADTAILSKSPIVLIDEIENAGIDRKKALDTLINEDKIVLMATHDPILALMGDKRIVIKNGGIDKVIDTTKKEKSILCDIQKLDAKIMGLRTKLRQGEVIEEI